MCTCVCVCLFCTCQRQGFPAALSPQASDSPSQPYLNQQAPKSRGAPLVHVSALLHTSGVEMTPPVPSSGSSASTQKRRLGGEESVDGPRPSTPPKRPCTSVLLVPPKYNSTACPGTPVYDASAVRRQILFAAPCHVHHSSSCSQMQRQHVMGNRCQENVQIEFLTEAARRGCIKGWGRNPRTSCVFAYAWTPDEVCHPHV